MVSDRRYIMSVIILVIKLRVRDVVGRTIGTIVAVVGSRRLMVMSLVGLSPHWQGLGFFAADWLLIVRVHCVVTRRILIRSFFGMHMMGSHNTVILSLNAIFFGLSSIIILRNSHCIVALV
jgi:hypothetical protein